MRTTPPLRDLLTLGFASAMVGSFAIAGWWWNRWFLDGWSFPDTGLGSLFGADGECSYDVTEFQMRVVVLVVLLPLACPLISKLAPRARMWLAYALAGLWSLFALLWLHSAFVLPLQGDLESWSYVFSVCETNLEHAMPSLPRIVRFEAVSLAGAMISVSVASGCSLAGRRITSRCT